MTNHTDSSNDLQLHNPDHEPGQLSPSLTDRELLAIFSEVMDGAEYAFRDILEQALIDEPCDEDQTLTDVTGLHLLGEALRLAHQRTAGGE